MTPRLCILLLLTLGLLSCTSTTPTSTPAVPAVVKHVVPKDEEGHEMIEPERVRSKQVQIDNRGVKTVTMGNANGEYALGCNMKANNCVTPTPGRDYYIFNKAAKWRMPGATESITLKWVQDWTESYPTGENIALVASEGGQVEELGMYWLVSWTAGAKTTK